MLYHLEVIIVKPIEQILSGSQTLKRGGFEFLVELINNVNEGVGVFYIKSALFVESE